MRARLSEPIASRGVAFSRYVLAPSYTGFTLRRLKVVLMVTRWYALRFILLKGHCQGNVKSLAGRRARHATLAGGAARGPPTPTGAALNPATPVCLQRRCARHARPRSYQMRDNPVCVAPRWTQRRAYAGSTIVNTVCSGVDSHEMAPPCAVTISLAMARPRPAPPRLVARAASRR